MCVCLWACVCMCVWIVGSFHSSSCMLVCVCFVLVHTDLLRWLPQTRLPVWHLSLKALPALLDSLCKCHFYVFLSSTLFPYHPIRFMSFIYPGAVLYQLPLTSFTHLCLHIYASRMPTGTLEVVDKIVENVLIWDKENEAQNVEGIHTMWLMSLLKVKAFILNHS